MDLALISSKDMMNLKLFLIHHFYKSLKAILLRLLEKLYPYRQLQKVLILSLMKFTQHLIEDLRESTLTETYYKLYINNYMLLLK